MKWAILTVFFGALIFASSQRGLPAQEKPANDATAERIEELTREMARLRKAIERIADQSTLPDKAEAVTVHAVQPGVVLEVMVQDGQAVHKGEVLLLLENLDLALEVDAVKTLAQLKHVDIEATRNADAQDRATILKRHELEMAGLLGKLRILETKMSQLKVRSPIDGFVHAPDLKLGISGRPVDRGDLLLRVSLLPTRPRPDPPKIPPTAVR